MKRARLLLALSEPTRHPFPRPRILNLLEINPNRYKADERYPCPILKLSHLFLVWYPLVLTLVRLWGARVAASTVAAKSIATARTTATTRSITNQMQRPNGNTGDAETNAESFLPRLTASLTHNILRQTGARMRTIGPNAEKARHETQPPSSPAPQDLQWLTPCRPRRKDIPPPPIILENDLARRRTRRLARRDHHEGEHHTPTPISGKIRSDDGPVARINAQHQGIRQRIRWRSRLLRAKPGGRHSC